MSETRIDLRGLKCPLPALKLRKALSKIEPGAVVVAECTDEMAAIDVPHLLRETGDALLGQERRQGVLAFTIRKR
jgi:tRNA 2-thiouridine synthesizing protein A